MKREMWCFYFSHEIKYLKLFSVLLLFQPKMTIVMAKVDDVDVDVDDDDDDDDDDDSTTCDEM